MSTYTINNSKFNFFEIHSNADAVDFQKKITLKVQKNDFAFIKHISETNKVSMNQIIDDLILHEIVKFLKGLPVDEAITLINAADLINKDDRSKSLFYDVYGDDFRNTKLRYFDDTQCWEGRPRSFKHIAKILIKNKLFDFNMNGYPSEEELNG